MRMAFPKHIEIEARFMEIDKPAFLRKLKSVKATDLGEKLLEEIIFYDRELRWKKQGDILVRLRRCGQKIFLTYKRRIKLAADGAEEIEFSVSDFAKAKIFLQKIGLTAYRVQEKKRHSFKLGKVIIDIDTWPGVPTYVELEGPSEAALKEAARKLELNWRKVRFENPRWIIENEYGIPVGNLRVFTFKKVTRHQSTNGRELHE